jgi:hypothetical protein
MHRVLLNGRAKESGVSLSTKEIRIRKAASLSSEAAVASGGYLHHFQGLSQ